MSRENNIGRAVGINYGLMRLNNVWGIKCRNLFKIMLALIDLFWRTSPEGKKKSLPWGGCATELLPGAPTTQSYDLICKVPKRILLKTVIPGWLWRGITPEGGKQKIPICNWRPKRGDCHRGSHPEREVYMLITGFQPTNPIYGLWKRFFLTENLSLSYRCRYVIVGGDSDPLAWKYGISGLSPRSSGLIQSVRNDCDKEMNGSPDDVLFPKKIIKQQRVFPYYFMDTASSLAPVVLKHRQEEYDTHIYIHEHVCLSETLAYYRINKEH